MQPAHAASAPTIAGISRARPTSVAVTAIASAPPRPNAAFRYPAPPFPIPSTLTASTT